MGGCEAIGWSMMAPLWKAAIPGLSPVIYPVFGYVAILAVFFAISKMTKMPLIGVFASFAGDVLIKVWLSLGFILLVASVFCSM